jgi:hypothetical protein
MSEEILKIELAELLKTVRLKRKNGTVLEASDIEGIRDCCAEVRDSDSHLGELLFQFFNLAAQLTEKSFPVRIEFAVKMR